MANGDDKHHAAREKFSLCRCLRSRPAAAGTEHLELGETMKSCLSGQKAVKSADRRVCLTVTTERGKPSTDDRRYSAIFVVLRFG
jgi:hypothetical protein